MNQHKSRRTAFFLSIMALSLVPGRSADWPQWRGPLRDGIWRETGILKTFPSKGLKVSWRQPVGPGYSSPVVAQGRVYVTDSQNLEKPAVRERVLCFEETTGRRLWTHAYETTYPEWAFVPSQEQGPCATPLVDGGHVYVIGAKGHVHCLRTRDGQMVWQKDLARDHPVKVLECRNSPLLEGNLLIVCFGRTSGPSVIALDKNSGREIWQALDEPVSNSSPLIVEAGGKRQLIVWTGASVSSLNPTTGELWWREAMVTSNNDNIPSPVVQGTRLLISGLMFQLDADKPAATVLWPEARAASRRILSNTSTPFLQGEHLFSANTTGELVCLDAATGNLVWQTNSVTKLQNGASIHLAPCGDAMFLFTDRGDLIRARLTPQGYREISRAHLLEPTSRMGAQKFAWTPPAYANRHVYARNDTELVCASLAAAPPP